MTGAAAAEQLVDPSLPAVIGASVIGDAHVRTGLPCQDAFRAIVRDDLVVIAVADGLGSAAHADLGAATAAEAAAFRADALAGGDPVRAALEGVVFARESLEELAATEALELRTLACTLMVVVAAERIGIAHIGDGGVVALRGEQPVLVSPAAASEYVNEVTPLTSDEWIDHVRPSGCLPGVDAIAAFTDGCQHAAVRRDHSGVVRAHAGFFGPLFGYLREGVDERDGCVALAELLSGAKMCEHSDDDKTLVLATLR